MPTENEPITAEKIRRKKTIALLGTCQSCGQPVIETQHFRRTETGIQHALCFYDRAFAKREREVRLQSK